MFILTVLVVVNVVLACCLIGLILLQHGRGADAGAAFGSGASSTVFGARGSASFLTKTTAVLALVFFSNILFLTYLTSQVMEESSVMDEGILTGEAPTIVEPPPVPGGVVGPEETAPAERSDLPALPDE